MYITLLLTSSCVTTSSVSPHIIYSLPIITNSPQYYFTEITVRELKVLLLEKGIFVRNILLTDDIYIVVSEDWFIDNLLVGYKKWMYESHNNYMFKYDKNDCDDFARAFSFYCRTMGKYYPNFRCNFAVGDLFYKNISINHVINSVVVLDKNNKYKIIQIEPQDCRVIPSKKEHWVGVYHLLF